MSGLKVEEQDDAEDRIIIQRLYATCCKNGFSVPLYQEERKAESEGEDVFTFRVTISSLDMSATCKGKRKIEAKRAAASVLLSKIRERKRENDNSSAS